MNPFKASILACFAVNLAHAQDENLFRFDFGPFAIVFGEQNPGGCGSPGFINMGNQNFLYADVYEDEAHPNHLDWQYDGNFEIVPNQHFDSIIVYDRYVNSYALRISETEGVAPFDTSYSDLSLDNLFYYSPWVRMEPEKKNEYSFEKYGRGKTYWEPHKSGIDKDAFQKWYDEKTANYEEYGIDVYDRREVFSYQRQLKVALYHKSVKVVFTIKFFHRDGEC